MVQNLSYWLSDINDINRLWRSILLFGNNTACYKFALGSTLLEFSSKNIERATIEELAIPFAQRRCALYKYIVYNHLYKYI